MIRFAWLQSRTQALIAAGAVVALAAYATVTGVHLGHLYDTVIAPCAASGCSGRTVDDFLNNYRVTRVWLGVLVIVAPGLFGLFWGAPLVAREFETGTHRLAWTQSVSRTRWLFVRLGVDLLLSIATAAVLTMTVTWWAHPLDRVNLSAYSMFDQRNIVPIGYAAFGFVLGVAAGVVLRRTLLAIAVMLVAFTAARLGATTWLRARLLSPSHLTAPLVADGVGFGRSGSGPLSLWPNSPRLDNAWIYSTHIVDSAGAALTPQVVASTCPTLSTELPPPIPVPGGAAVRTQVPIGVKSAIETCVDKLSATYHTVTTYQPASHYWPLQWIELAIYLAAAAAVAGGCLWWLRNRIA